MRILKVVGGIILFALAVVGTAYTIHEIVLAIIERWG